MSQYLNRLNNFISLDSCNLKLMKGILVGGSRLYHFAFCDQKCCSENITSDWDGVVLVETKADLIDLVKSRDLIQLLGLTNDVTDFGDELETYKENFQCVRLSGYTIDGVKKSVKVLSFKCFENVLDSGSFFVNVLSHKDVRVLSRNSDDRGNQHYLFQQASSINDHQVILHDSVIATSRKPSKFYYGVLTDLILTGEWIYQDPNNSGESLTLLIWKKLFDFLKFTTMADCLKLHPLTLFKSKRGFHPEFENTLQARVIGMLDGVLDAKVVAGHECDAEADSLVFFNPDPHRNISGATPKQTFRDVCFSPLPKTVFSSNSSSGFVQMFMKVSQWWRQELTGAKLVNIFYNHVHEPIASDEAKTCIFYAKFDGTLLAKLRLHDTLIKDGGVTRHTKIVLEAEAVRAEDVLNAYLLSARMAVFTEAPSIDRFFYHRLKSNKRFSEFYSNGIQLDGVLLTYKDLLNIPIRVNGTNFDCLGTLFDEANKFLSPNLNDEDLVVCGPGDGHCGNVLINDDRSQLLMIDYEVSGFHSPFIDMAKPFYSDVFFDLFYADQTEKEFIEKWISVEVGDSIDIHLRLPNLHLSRAIMEIKTKFILEPFLKFVNTRKDLKLNQDWIKIFRSALLCCALLARNFTESPKVFFANLAVGVVLANMEGFTEGSYVGIDVIDM